MINRWLYILLLQASYWIMPGLAAQTPGLEKVRNQFFTMNSSIGGALNLYHSLERADLSKNAVLLAYRGASSAASAADVKGVWNKIEYFNRGKSELEKAVSLSPLDIEIRFLRLATQLNAPWFLGYNGDTGSDEKLIINTLKNVSPDHPNAYLYQRICRLLLSDSNLESADKKAINQLIIKFNSKK
ncbi:MAG: hypothetical protein WCR72_07045 [Bacteroidota bacterium]